MRNAANDLFDLFTLVVVVGAVVAIVYAANNAEFSNYLTEIKHAISDYFL
jgi:hypothetical protein